MKLPSLTHVTRSLHALQYGERVRPYRDWMAVITLAGILLILSAGWSYVLFRQVSAGSNLGNVSAPTHLNTATLETVRAVFEKRAEEQAHYLSDYHFVDPAR
jgi:hypothetical protein